MDRRNFFRLSSATAATSLLPSANASENCDNAMAGGVYYTIEHPGRWAKKVGGHIPNIVKIQDKGKLKVKVITWHEMSYPKHYIVKHMILDADYNFLAEYVFDPDEDEAATTTFDLGNYRGRIYVLSVCNTHDTWMSFSDI